MYIGDNISFEGQNFDQIKTPQSGTERTNYVSVMEEEEMVNLNKIKNILDVEESSYPEFILAKNRLRFKKKLTWYKGRKDWLDIAPIQKINKAFQATN